jgi:hypothetical protein
VIRRDYDKAGDQNSAKPHQRSVMELAALVALSIGEHQTNPKPNKSIALFDIEYQVEEDPIPA